MTPNAMKTAIKERPISSSAEEVKAILDGRKTQMRLVMNPQPTYMADVDEVETYSSLCGPEWYEPTIIGRDGCEREGKRIYGVYSEDGEWGCKCPYEPGDRLWVREKFRFAGGTEIHYCDGDVREHAAVLVRLQEEKVRTWSQFNRWRSSIHMPRWASRLTLEITEVRVERLNSISEEDAEAEGIDDAWLVREHVSPDLRVACFRELWDSINGEKYPWSNNEFVWCISFERAQA
jgi:hypothetical protein